MQKKHIWILGRVVFIALFALALSGCEINISATRTPSVTEGTTVFGILNWQTPDRAIDIVFIPDDDYGNMSNTSNLQDFLDDVSNLIDEGFYQNNGIAVNLGLFNFWYMTQTGDVQAGTGICPSATWPNLADAAFAEVIVLVHQNTLRDCRWGNKVTTEPTSYRTIVHEASHAAFNLPDEYCCDGGYWVSPPILYSSFNNCNTDSVNAGWRNCQSFTSNSGTTYWRSEDTICCIMGCGGGTVLEYGSADWVVARNVLSGLGPTVNDPSVFAPDPWDWP